MRRLAGSALATAVMAWFPAAASAATDAEHINRLAGLHQSGTTDCARLNAAYFAARDFPQPSSELEAALSTMFVYRERQHCLVMACPPGQKCPGPRKRFSLSDHFDRTQQELSACLRDTQCQKTNDKTLRNKLLDAVIVIVRTYPERDPLVTRVLERIGVGLAEEGEVLRRCAELLEDIPVEDQHTVKILRGVARQLKNGTIDKEIVLEVTGLLEHLGDAAKADPEVRKDLLSAIAKLLKTHGANNLVGLAEALGTGDEGQRLSLLLQTARDLAVPKNRAALAQAVQLILKYHPQLAEQVRGELEKQQQVGDLQAQLVALTKIMNGAELEELRRLREAARIWQVSFASERALRVLAINRRPKGCPSTKSSPVCSAAETLWHGFYAQLNDKTGHGADEAVTAEEAPAAEIIATTVNLLERDMPSTGASTAPASAPCDKARYGDLCTGPYIGVYVLDVEAQRDGREGAICGRAYYAVRGVDFKVQSDKQGMDPICVDDHGPIDQKGRELASRALRKSTINKYFPKEQCSTCLAAPERAVSWQRWASLGTLAGGTVAAVSGVYLSNTNPESAVGDRLWQSGLVLLTSSLVFHIVELASD